MGMDCFLNVPGSLWEQPPNCASELSDGKWQGLFTTGRTDPGTVEFTGIG